MAHKKSGGSTSNGRDSNPKMRGIKKYGGEEVIVGNIIVRQKGTKFHPGTGVKMGRDYTIYAVVPGKVKFAWLNKNDKSVSVVPA
jgi:large subunit ribosomal protein L27